MESPKPKEVNIWFIATIILAIALVVVFVVKGGSGKLIGPDGKETQALQPKEAADKLVQFFTRLGGSGLSPISEPVTLNDLVEESGMYKLNVTYQMKDQTSGEKKPVSGEFYLTRDGKLFTDKVYSLEEALSQLDQQLNTVKAPAESGTGTSTPSANSDVNSGTNSAGAGSSDSNPLPQ